MFFFRCLNVTVISLFYLNLMCLTLALTMIEKVQPPCLNLAARLHLPSHPFDFMHDG